MWFKKLTGFEEINPDFVRKNIEIEGQTLKSLVNRKKYNFGKLEIPTLQQIIKNSPSPENYNSKMKIEEIIADVQELHEDKNNNGAVFQAASQFNLLEMVSPNITPEQGVGIYEYDHTQGPACAIACGAGTIFRNYFVEVNGKKGQTTNNQIDCLSEIGIALDNEKHNLWEMQNGYAALNERGLKIISDKFSQISIPEYKKIKEKLKVGIQYNTEVTADSGKNLVTQVYCSALPVAYYNIKSYLWRDFAKMILDAAYEATFYIALENFQNTGNNKLYLTLVGGGAFGNDDDWIFDAIKKSKSKFAKTPLDVKIVSYGKSNKKLTEFIELIH